MDKTEMKSLFENAKKENESNELSKIDIETILQNSENYSYLEGKSLNIVSQEIYDSLLVYPGNLIEHYYQQLVEDYRFVEKVCDLRLGIYTKFLDGSQKAKGGILVKIDVYEDKISLLCKNGIHFQRYSFNDCLVYQKLSLEEKMVLLSFDYYKNV
jgi:hypothetical protein